MVTTRSALESIEGNLLESMGSRRNDQHPRLSPAPRRRDAGRRPAPQFGDIQVDQVIPDADQPRTEYCKESIDRLAASIRQTGQLSPIRVRWSDDLKKWVIIAGERRWRAAKRAGLPTIQCYFHEDELSKSEILEQQLIENLLRDDLKPIEEARAFQRLIELNAWSNKQVAEALRVPASKVSRALALLKLPHDIQEQVNAGAISARGAYELSRIENPRVQRHLAGQSVSNELTHQQVAKAVRQRQGKRRETHRGTKLTFPTEHGWTVAVKARKCGTYHDIELALEEALAEVRHRIQNNVQLF